MPQAQVEYITNKVDLGEVSLTKLDFHYRWRYLNQTILGTAGSKTLSATPETAAQATLSGATLYLPQSQFDSEFTHIPVQIGKIVLGNTSYETATVVQYLRITTQEGVYESERLNGDGGYDFNHDGNYDAADKAPRRLLEGSRTSLPFPCRCAPRPNTRLPSWTSTRRRSPRRPSCA